MNARTDQWWISSVSISTNAGVPHVVIWNNADQPLLISPKLARELATRLLAQADAIEIAVAP